MAKGWRERDLPCTSLAREMEMNGHDSIDLLKIDIEGFEYEVLESCLAERIPIKQICVEFHDFFPEIPKAKTRAMIRALESHGFDLIHRHRHDHTFLRRAHTNARFLGAQADSYETAFMARLASHYTINETYSGCNPVARKASR